MVNDLVRMFLAWVLGCKLEFICIKARHKCFMKRLFLSSVCGLSIVQMSKDLELRSHVCCSAYNGDKYFHQLQNAKLQK